MPQQINRIIFIDIAIPVIIRYTSDGIRFRSQNMPQQVDRIARADRSKVDRAIRIACGKRPVSDEQIRTMIDHVVANLEGDEVPADKIAELVMSELHKVDEVAYIRFASVYRQFKDVAQFLSAITEIVKK